MKAPAAAEEAVVTALWERGTAGVHVQPGPPGTVVLVAYFPQGDVAASDLRSSLSACGATDVEAVAILEVDWVARFREGFRAFDAGGFRIVPSWDPAPERDGGRTLRILPARAFGTGTHESTRLCLTALQALAARRPLGRVADIGTGTGILAVAAALLGARPVVATDIDPEATESARMHAGLNAVDVHVVHGDGARSLARGRFDLLLANLTAPLLLERRDEIAALGGPRSFLVLAGFLRDDAEGVAEAYSSAGAAAVSVDGEWAALVIERTA